MLNELKKAVARYSYISFVNAINEQSDIGDEIAQQAYSDMLDAREDYIKGNPQSEIARFVQKTSLDSASSKSLSAITKKMNNLYLEILNEKDTDRNGERHTKLREVMTMYVDIMKKALRAKGIDPVDALKLNDPNIGSEAEVYSFIEQMANVSKDFIANKRVHQPEKMGNDFNPVDLLNKFNIPYIEGCNNGSFMTGLDDKLSAIHVTHKDDVLGSVAHELGHALYQNEILSKSDIGSVLGNAPSLALHESSSIFFELSIAGCNQNVNSGYHNIKRLTADKVHYILHIYMRMTIERELLTDQITIDDIPQRWDELSEELLGMKPKNDLDGWLQDVHWIHGAFGYFHSYAIGFFNALNMLNEVESQFKNYGNYDLVNTVLLPTIEEKYGWVTIEDDGFMVKMYPNMEDSVEVYKDMINKKMTWGE